jgi:predicted nucleic acid-binding protein
MRRYLVDTTPLAALLNGLPPATARLTPLLTAAALGTSIMVYGEVVESFKRYPDFARRHTALRRMLRVVHPYLVSYRTMERYADIRRQLRPPYGPGLIGDIDTVIAATALTYNLELITTDRDFLRVPGLRVLLLDRVTFQPRTS